MRFAFIHAEKAKLPKSLLCRVLKVSRSGFYKLLVRGRQHLATLMREAQLT